MNTLTLSDLLPEENHWEIPAKVKLLSELAENHGMHFFPLCGVVNQHGTCGRKGETLEKAGKHPMPGVSMFDATPNPAHIATYANGEPFCNFGINVEKSNLLVIDIDPRNGGHTSWEAFRERFELPNYATSKVRTGKVSEGLYGEHIYFRYDGADSFIGDLNAYGLPGVDIKRKGYVVAPSSMHKSGVAYEFEPGCAPWESGISELPMELLALLRKTGDYWGESGGEAPSLPPVSLDALTETCEVSTPYGKAALEGEVDRVRKAAEGTRNKTLFSAGARLASLVAGGELTYAEMHSNLSHAAYLSGLQEGEIEAVLTRPGGAYDRGAMKPATAPQVPSSLIDWAVGNKVDSPLEVDARLAQFLERANVQPMEHILGEHEPEKWIVPGFICYGRGHALLSSSGLGKSLLMREMVAKLTTGEGFWGSDANKPIRVLYLDYENDPVYDIGASLKAMQLADPETYGDRLTIASYPVFGYFDTPEGAADLELAIDYFQPDLVVIDTLSRVVEGEENANDTWLKFYRSSGMVFKRKNLAYVRIDHIGKDATRGARGGSAKTGDIDLIWTLEEEGADGEFKLTNSKSRVFLEKKEFHMKRLSSPLEHVLVQDKGGNYWSKLVELGSKYQETYDLMASLHAGGGLKGQKAVWADHKDFFEENHITKKLVEIVHGDFKANLASAPVAPDTSS